MGPGPWRYVAAFAVTFVLAAALTPLMRHFALRTSVVDAPDGERKLQTHAIPYLGGIAIALSATLIYRVLTFWLPVLLTAATYRLVLGGVSGHREQPQ